MRLVPPTSFLPRSSSPSSSLPSPGPCKVLTPILKTVVGPGSTTDLITIDTDAHNSLAGEYKIAALPTVLAFRDGKQVGKFVGARNAAGVKEFLGSL